MDVLAYIALIALFGVEISTVLLLKYLSEPLFPTLVILTIADLFLLARIVRLRRLIKESEKKNLTFLREDQNKAVV